MKAIVNLPKSSAYSKYNGRTFEVKDLLNTIVSLKINGSTVDFSLKEIIIVDIEKEVITLQNLLFDNKHLKIKDKLEIKSKTLQKYISTNNIILRK